MQISNRFSLGNSWPNNVEIGIDTETQKWLSDLLPVEINLELEGDVLRFSNIYLPALGSSAVRSEYRFASGSGRLDLEMSSVRDLSLKIVDLEELVREASRSGELYTSPVLSRLSGLINGIRSVELEISGKRIKGQLWIAE